MGVVVRRYIDFLIILLIPTPLLLALFCSSIPSYFFVHFKNVSSSFKRKKKCQIVIFYSMRRARKMRCYSDVIYSFD